MYTNTIIRTSFEKTGIRIHTDSTGLITIDTAGGQIRIRNRERKEEVEVTLQHNRGGQKSAIFTDLYNGRCIKMGPNPIQQRMNKEDNDS
jgi:hypothetical protein